MEDVAVEIVEDAISEIDDSPPQRKRGRPDGAKTKKVARKPSVVGSTRYKNYYTGHHNKAQDTRASWAWIDGLDEAEKEILDLTVYRDWPVLKMPLKSPEGTTRKNPKSIGEQIPGTKAFKTDQDLVDMFGAGDYRVYVNVNPEGQARRELFCNVVKATHDFRAFPPTDWRIDDINNIDLSDPSNGSYVAWLKSQGKVPDEGKELREKEEMATATQGLTEVLGKALDRGDRLMEKLMDERTAEPEPSEPPQSPKEVFNDQVAMFKSVKELMPTADPLEMTKQVIGMAQLLTQKDGSVDLKPLMDQIDKLREESRTTERQMWQSQLADIKERLAAKETTTPTMLASDGVSLEGIVQRVVEKFMDKPEPSPWLDIAKSLTPVLQPLGMMLIQRLSAPPQPASAFPMPPATYQAGAQPSQQPAQLPAPAQSQQAAPQPPPQTGAYTTGNPQLDALLMAVVIPLADCLRDGETGAVFASDFIELQGIEYHTMLAQVGVEPIANIIAAYPPLAGVMKKITREKLLKFVSEFCEYKPDAAAGATAS